VFVARLCACTASAETMSSSRAALATVKRGLHESNLSISVLFFGLGIVSKERQRSFDKPCGRLAVACIFAEYRPVFSLRNDPKAGAGNCGKHFQSEVDRVQRVTIAVNNQSAGCNSRQVRRGEVHVIVTAGE